MLITTHKTDKESPKEVPAPEGIDSDKDSTNNDQDNEENEEVSIRIDEDTGKYQFHMKTKKIFACQSLHYFHLMSFENSRKISRKALKICHAKKMQRLLY